MIILNVLLVEKTLDALALRGRAQDEGFTFLNCNVQLPMVYLSKFECVGRKLHSHCRSLLQSFSLFEVNFEPRTRSMTNVAGVTPGTF